MNLAMGNVIKRLRAEHGVTQEELANFLGISFQAVSKWENGSTLPDVTLLPKLASFFGVRIDEFFSVDHEDELERIDHMLQRETMTDQNYAYAKRILDGVLADAPKDVAAIKQYAKVLLTKANALNLEAGRMLEGAMELSPLDEEVYGLYRNARSGSEYKYHSDNAWFIRVCEPYAKKYPQNTGLYQMLIEAMISKKYFDRAQELLEVAAFEGEQAHLREIFLGDVALAKGNEAAARGFWSSVPKADWLAQYEVGERLNRLGDYEAAIVSFENAFAAQEPPRKLDMVYSLAFLYKKLGRFAKAKEAWEEIARALQEDYGFPADHNDIKWTQREIAQLEELIGKQ